MLVVVLLSGDPFIAPNDCVTLAAQAQAKIAAVEEEVKKLQALQTELKQKRQILTNEQTQWAIERDKQRLALAAEREAAMADIEASRKALKKERRRFDTDFEGLQELSIRCEKLDEQNRQLKLSLAQLQVRGVRRGRS